MSLVKTVAYHSLPLGLTVGITGSLFLLPLLKNGNCELLDRVIPQFTHHGALGGMMITEPGGGTDIFNLQSFIDNSSQPMVLNGTKCWGGLTGQAEHWLVAARVIKRGKPTRRIKLLYIPRSAPGMNLETKFDALGLQPIPYGQTKFDGVDVPHEHDLVSRNGGSLRMIYDTLFRSRLGISAIAAGLCERLADEAAHRARVRNVFGRPIVDYDQVRFRLETMRGWSVICNCVADFATELMDRKDDLSTDYIPANAVKTVTSTAMAEAADNAVHLFASAAYKNEHVAGRAYVDARPFQIFEGSNDVLNANTYEVIMSQYGVFSPDAIKQELARHELAWPETLPPGVVKALHARSDCLQRHQVHYGLMAGWGTILSIIESAESRLSKDAFCEAQQLIYRRLVSMAAELPYLSVSS